MNKEQCNCDQFPFLPDPPCFEICAGKMLALLSREHLISTLGIEARVADKIVSLPDRAAFTSLDAFQPVLGDDDLDHVVDRFETLSPHDHAILRQHLNL